MVDIVLVNNITDDLIQMFNLNREDELYEFCLDNKVIGHGIIRKNSNNKIYVVIAKKYQGRGYGGKLFEFLLSKTNESMEFSIPKDNYVIQRIIQKNKGIEIGRDKEEVFYLIDKNN